MADLSPTQDSGDPSLAAEPASETQLHTAPPSATAPGPTTTRDQLDASGCGDRPSSARTAGAQPEVAGHGDLPSDAPVVGLVRKLPVPRLLPATRHRPAAVTLDGVQVGDLHVSAASIIGTSHVAIGSVRQDAYNFVATADGHLVLAVADGLGSRSLSHLGAALFGEGVAQAALGLPLHSPPTAAELLIRGAEYVTAAARDFYQVALADVAFVAAVAVLAPAGLGEMRMAEIARIGDVTAFVADPAGPLTELFIGDDGPINVLSESLPAAAASEPEVVRGQAPMLALVTDGLANDLRTSPAVRSWLSQRWAQPIGPFGFGDSLRYQRQGSHDDRTAVVVWQPAHLDEGADRRLSRVPWNFGGGPLIIRLPSDPHSGLRR
jgi:hypothetical protein